MILMADEVGFMMNPSVKKTWARRGRTPVVPFRNRRHKKVGVPGAVAKAGASCQRVTRPDGRESGGGGGNAWSPVSDDREVGYRLSARN